MAFPETLIKKWRKLFHYRDTDNDGIVTEKDYIGYSEHFVTVYGERAKPARQIAKLIWDTFTPRGYQPQVTEQELIDNYIYLYKHDLKGFKDKIEKYCHLSFDAIDANGDGEITLVEYSIYQNGFGIYNKEYIEHIFNQMDINAGGTIDRKEFVKEIMDYVFEDMPEKIPELYDDDQAKNFRKDEKKR